MNKLANENSPYLLEHSNNPVNWYPWSDEAFNIARDQDKPVFLSIGYSSCHWCHVMEQESFMDKSVAEKMNDTFVCIKVDREERPDIDNLYMTFSQVMTGTGGWPLNLVLTPDRKPVFAFTYIPKISRNNMIGMMDLCDNISYLWKNKRDELVKNGDEAISRLKNIENSNSGTQKIDYSKYIDSAYESLKRNYDREYGGFGSAPKFPSFQHLIFLMNYHKKTGDGTAMEMVETTLKNMYLGGMYDHIGGGFHRYSTDPFFRIPHFEKMTYDQAMAIMAYSYAYDITHNDFYRDAVYEIYKFLKDNMFSRGFYTAVDADSENQEGKFYTWTYSELKYNTSKDFLYDFNILPEGNFYDNNSRQSGRNILFMNRDVKGNPARLYRSELDKLKQIRNLRKKPLVDDKILADINGLVIKALSLASMVFQDKDMLATAEDSADFIMNDMYCNGKLMHSFRNGSAAVEGMFDDYSYMVSGLLSLYEASQNDIYLNYARELHEKLIRSFYDSANGGFYSAGSDLLVRLKETYDNAIPSGFSFEIGNLAVLNYLDGNLEEVLDKSIGSIAPDMERQPMFFSYTISNLFNMIEFYKVETGSGEVLEYLGSHYPYNYYFIGSNSNEISVCDTNKCFIVKSLSDLKGLIKC
ncbi:MAG: thioredoxin domain-containing protein [Ferroplasma sp.]|uniref:thioredoxin domain-containing protein n=1 Tax=Ferroplasma sp. TaxID=2591003 RepID=UPI0028157D97|nr:thioredoxin domain-containing protein [Ferroplasma sp.]WMT51972.1 MAG: thioredoxin domain-containing protein [Ferroplasma sp.]